MESHIKLESTKEIAIWQERAFSIELALDSILIFSIYAISKKSDQIDQIAFDKWAMP